MLSDPRSRAAAAAAASWAATNRAGSTDRNASAEAGTPSSAATSSAIRWAPPTEGQAMRDPLMQTADRKSPSAAGHVNRAAQAIPPADCPAIVTLAGSPPKAAMFSCTQRRAASQSSKPRFSGAPSTAMKPSAPNR